MLINLEASNVNGFKMPYMPFQKSTVTVTEFFIKFSQAVQVHGSVKSTLVDRNPLVVRYYWTPTRALFE